MISLAKPAYEESTYPILFEFEDEDGNVTSPSAMTWSLVDENNVIINSREDVAVSSPTSSETILLEGDDLALSGNYPVTRYIIAKITYASLLGAGLVTNRMAAFTIIPVFDVP